MAVQPNVSVNGVKKTGHNALAKKGGAVDRQFGGHILKGPTSQVREQSGKRVVGIGVRNVRLIWYRFQDINKV